METRGNRVGLRTKFIVTSALLLALTLGLSAHYNSKQEERLLLASLQARVEALARFTAFISAEAIYTFDITTLDRFVSEMNGDPEIRFAAILNSRGKLITTVLPQGWARQDLLSILSTEGSHPELWRFSVPVVIDGESLGTVEVAIDDSRVRAEIAAILQQALLIYGAIILFLVFVLSAIFQRVVLRQVKQLIAGAVRISSGDYSFQLQVLAQDELSQLTHCFNKMLSDLNDSHSELLAMNRQLEEEVEQRRHAEEQMRLDASVFRHAREGITITDSDGTILKINDGFCNITGYSREEVLGQNPRILQSGQHDKAFYHKMWQQLACEGYWSGEIWNRRKNGEIVPELLTINAIVDEGGNVEHYVALFSDISTQKAHEQQLQHIAHYDALTELPNRVLLGDRLQQEIKQSRRVGTLLAVIYLDLDGFKAVNDTYGHDVGDRLLVTVTGRMQLSIRESDTLARLGGDEFVAVLGSLESSEECLPLLERLLQAAAEPILIEQHALRVSASIGVTFYPQPEEVDADQLLRQADQAMYQAKKKKKNRYHFFNPEDEYEKRGHNKSLEQIAFALSNGEFELYYQPQVNLRSGEIVGFEALLRWHHPQQGLLYPGSFLPPLRGNAILSSIGVWVVEQAMS
ncbi:MAG: diguanylate cyclase, partial [Gammaproteobacteria bacterium]|nr:diguanylate cyclase [Gammaproteobacteria bacterium]